VVDSLKVSFPHVCTVVHASIVADCAARCRPLTRRCPARPPAPCRTLWREAPWPRWRW
jgi:hypothetical protein